MSTLESIFKIVKVGQIWKERDHRFHREVEVIAIDRAQYKAQILNKRLGRKTWASLERFDGTKPSRGYIFVRDSA